MDITNFFSKSFGGISTSTSSTLISNTFEEISDADEAQTDEDLERGFKKCESIRQNITDF